MRGPYIAADGWGRTEFSMGGVKRVRDREGAGAPSLRSKGGGRIGHMTTPDFRPLPHPSPLAKNAAHSLHIFLPPFYKGGLRGVAVERLDMRLRRAELRSAGVARPTKSPNPPESQASTCTVPRPPAIPGAASEPDPHLRGTDFQPAAPLKRPNSATMRSPAVL